ncbi:GNAT family N-acetyltransferase [Actinoplanes sp. NPDC051633]|uniref:GNAT family N-acetyltransferase n=1 Tax=Actinoplanes sp. NPDC051633 TaxID=3155670 RepID=UPI003449A286
MEIHALDAGRLSGAVDLFESNPTMRGCWCQYMRLKSSEVSAGWGDGNRRRFAEQARCEDPPSGLLAYDDGGTTVGWCAVGPRSRFARLLRSPLTKTWDRAEDDTVWLLPCFFVRSGHRRKGVTHRLLLAAIEHSRSNGAVALEAMPLAGAGPHKSDRYYGTEPLFEACGFTVQHRPSAGRVLMRLPL